MSRFKRGDRVHCRVEDKSFNGYGVVTSYPEQLIFEPAIHILFDGIGELKWPVLEKYVHLESDCTDKCIKGIAVADCPYKEGKFSDNNKHKEGEVCNVCKFGVPGSDKLVLKEIEDGAPIIKTPQVVRLIEESLEEAFRT